MEKKSWVCTVVTQISLCFALYLAFKVGQPRRALFDDGMTRSSKPFDLFFITVAGDFRPLEEQALLLRQMAKVAEVFKAQFVVSISEPGEDDPLSQNATSYFWSLEVPCFLNLKGPSSGAREHQLSWLTKTLEESISDWRIVVGFHPFLACNGTTEAGDSSEPLHHILLNYGVNACLSGEACTEYVPEGTAERLGDASPKARGPCLTPLNKILHPNKDNVDGFLLHRVNSLEFVTYFVNLNAEVVDKIELKQIGKEVM